MYICYTTYYNLGRVQTRSTFCIGKLCRHTTSGFLVLYFCINIVTWLWLPNRIFMFWSMIWNNLKLKNIGRKEVHQRHNMVWRFHENGKRSLLDSFDHYTHKIPHNAIWLRNRGYGLFILETSCKHDAWICSVLWNSWYYFYTFVDKDNKWISWYYWLLIKPVTK